VLDWASELGNITNPTTNLAEIPAYMTRGPGSLTSTEPLQGHVETNGTITT